MYRSMREFLLAMAIERTPDGRSKAEVAADALLVRAEAGDELSVNLVEIGFDDFLRRIGKAGRSVAAIDCPLPELPE